MQVFYLDLDLIRNRSDLLSLYEYWLSAAERERFLQIQDEERKLAFLGGHALIHDVVGLMETCPPQFVMVDLRNNVPFLDTIPLYVNLSHSGGLVALAVDKMPVGLDIERTSARPNVNGMIDEAFEGHAARTFSLLKKSERRPFFFRVWTMREAAYKWQTLFSTNKKLMEDLPKRDKTYETGELYMPLHFYSGIINDMYFSLAAADPLTCVTVTAKVPGEPKETILSPRDVFLV